MIFLYIVIKAATHFVPNPFDPRTSGPPTSRTPGQINGPQPIWSPYFQIITSCPPTQREYLGTNFSRGNKLVGNHLSKGTKFLGTICPWGQNWLGTVCPEGPINWGLIVGDQMFGDHMCLGPNVSQPQYIREHVALKTFSL